MEIFATMLSGELKLFLILCLCSRNEGTSLIWLFMVSYKRSSTI